MFWPHRYLCIFSLILLGLAAPCRAAPRSEADSLSAEERQVYHHAKNMVADYFTRFPVLEKKGQWWSAEDATFFMQHSRPAWMAFKDGVISWNRQHRVVSADNQWDRTKDQDRHSRPICRYLRMVKESDSMEGFHAFDSLMQEGDLTPCQTIVVAQDIGAHLTDETVFTRLFPLLNDRRKDQDYILFHIGGAKDWSQTDPVFYRICDNIAASIEKIYHPHYGDLKYGVDYADPEFFCEIPAAKRKNFQALVDRRIELLKAWGAQYQKRIALRRQLRQLLAEHAEAGLTEAQFAATLDLWQSLAGSGDSDKAQDEVFPVLVETFLANAKKQGKGSKHTPAIQREVFSCLCAFLQSVNQNWTDNEPIVIRPLEARALADFPQALAWLREEVTLLKSKTRKNRNPNDFFTHTGRINTLLSVVETAAEKPTGE